MSGDGAIAQSGLVDLFLGFLGHSLTNNARFSR
jgi:hypothetical protein